MKKLSDINIACVITTFNRASEARAQMDIIRELWQPFFGSIDIYHEFNGKKEWYPNKYREDFLFRHVPKPHYEGAIYLIEQGIEHALQNKQRYDFLVVASADVWLYNPKKICQIIELMVNGKYELACSVWPINCLATEFFVVTPSLANKIFPLNYTDALRKHKTLKLAHTISHSKVAGVIPWLMFSVVENLFTWKVLGELRDIRKIMLIPGRRFVFVYNRFYSKNFYSSHHDFAKRKKAVSSKMSQLLKGKEIKSELLREIIE